jgi:hypothetical protein
VSDGRIVINWHPSVRSSVRRRGSGVVVSVETFDDEGTLREALKVDAFGRAHWHLYLADGRQHVHPLDGMSLLRGGEYVLWDLVEHLEQAGYATSAASLSDGDHLRLINDIGKAIEDLTG